MRNCRVGNGSGPSGNQIDPPRALYFWLPYVVVASVVCTQYTARTWHVLLPLAFVWVVVPLFDILFAWGKRRKLGDRSSIIRNRICSDGIVDDECCSVSSNNGRRAQISTSQQLSPAQRAEIATSWSFRAPVLLWAPMQLALFVWAARRVSDKQITHEPARIVALLASMTLVAAGGINCAHELLHRKSLLEQALGQILLVSVCYGHFFIEHARGHHKRVATPHDPATLQFGESFYHFLPKTLIGGFRSAWMLEKNRLNRTGRTVWSLRNAMIWYIIAPMALFIAPFAAALGARAVIFYLLQSFGAVVLLEQVNAIEHYGLTRRRLPDGSYEPVGPQHSWDGPYTASNYLLFKLQRHPDHHLHVGKRYQVLDVTPESPQLPIGYLTLAPCLLVPPLWRAVMDPVLADYRAKYLTSECLDRQKDGA